MKNYQTKGVSNCTFKFVTSNVMCYIVGLLMITNSCNSKPDHVQLTKERDSLLIENKELRLQFLTLESKSKRVTTGSFDVFLFHFMTDTVFQNENIKFPLAQVFLNLEHGGLDTSFVNKNKWLHDPIYAYSATERSQVYDNFKMMINNSTERVVHWYGLENGADVRYFFKFSGKGRWELIKIEEFGT